MGKTSKWLRSILTGKKGKVKDSDKCPKTTDINLQQDRIPPPTTTTTTPKEKRRWSFRRSSASSTTPTTATATTPPPPAESNPVASNSRPTDIAADDEQQQMKHAMAVASATAVMSLTAEEAAAVKIQSVFRSYLAKKALCALRGLVKLQALVRGHLVRKQATDTLRRMQALVTAQARARAHRIQMVLSEDHNFNNITQRRHLQENMFTQIYDEIDMNQEENIKIVEMDVCETKGDYRRRRNNINNNNYNPNYHHTYYSPNQEAQPITSPSPSTLTDMSPRAFSSHFEDCTSFGTAQSSPQLYYSAMSRPEDLKNLPFTFPKPPPNVETLMSYDYPLFPNYMANTESSRAKARSQSAPKQRPPETFERQPSRRRASVEGRNVPRPVRMQRSSSHVGSTAHNYQYPWSMIRLDKSSASLNNSECGSSSTVLTNTNYGKSLVAFDPYGGRYYN